MGYNPQESLGFQAIQMGTSLAFSHLQGKHGTHSSQHHEFPALPYQNDIYFKRRE